MEKQIITGQVSGAGLPPLLRPYRSITMNERLLTAREIVTACRLAYDEKRLLAQSPMEFFKSSDSLGPSYPCWPMEYGYSVDVAGRNYRCAIGAVFDAELEELSLQWPTYTLASSGAVIDGFFRVTPEEFDDLNELQLIHDKWHSHVRGSGEYYSYEQIFIDLLKKLEDKYC